MASRNFSCAAICAEFTRCVYREVVVGLACRIMLWISGRLTSFDARKVSTTGLINGNVRRRASMGPNNKAGPTKLAS